MSTGPALSHSQTVHEQVSAAVTLDPERHPGDYPSPDHVHRPGVTRATPVRRSRLQAQRGDSNNWKTIKTGRLNASSSYSIPFAWRFAGPRNVRAVFPGDRRNTRGISAVSTVVVEQTEVPGFTIGSSNPIVPNQTPVTISGNAR